MFVSASVKRPYGFFMGPFLIADYGEGPKHDIVRKIRNIRNNGPKHPKQSETLRNPKHTSFETPDVTVRKIFTRP